MTLIAKNIRIGRKIIIVALITMVHLMPCTKIQLSKCFVDWSKNITCEYTVYIGDGETSSFGAVKEALCNKFHNDYPVKKEDCIGHLQKRMGSDLRIYKNKCCGSKLADGKTVGGRGRLTDAVVDKIQDYYGVAIRCNIG